ncbi:STAS-like domain-containing protein [uncultured Enterococcus sp.]|jgi:hypothetical protein|uniref:STAS-like domain-containing protein n=1 Tax=Enterococcus gallinarum TaxID=1353 RepID=UPI00258BE14B|nr:STAS-like domain-containing protein [uncultured Enterococcus sp.]MCW3745379.1 STAS-like domain-containing protein [Enterococcus gallinarum]
MVKVNLLNDLKTFSTNDDGDVLFEILRKNLDAGNKVVVSFEGVHGLNSSFVNSAFIRLLDLYSFDFIKKNVGFESTNKQINQLILSRFKFETSKCTA